MKIVIATTTKCVSSTPVEKVRMDLTLKTLFQAAQKEIPVVAVDKDSEDDFVSKATKYGAKIIPQKKNGMGYARRQSIKAAIGSCNNNNDVIVWLEPEKCNMVPHLKYLVELHTRGKCLYLFKRNSLDSYPKEQQLTYRYGQVLSKYVFGEVIDLFFGPVAFTKNLAHYFLDYDGVYGDTWDSIHIPKMRAIASGEPYFQIQIEYCHPFIQTSAEMGNAELFIKRIKQAYELSNAYWTEAKKLNLILKNGSSCSRERWRYCRRAPYLSR